jgi:hypothetical protein
MNTAISYIPLLILAHWRTNGEAWYDVPVDDGRKRVLAIIAGILVARHLKNPEDLRDSRPSPRTESLITSAVQWPERIMRRVENA